MVGLTKLKNLVLINPPTLTNEAYYQATHGKYIVESAKIFPTLDDFYQSQRIDFKVASKDKIADLDYSELQHCVYHHNKTFIVFELETFLNKFKDELAKKFS